MGGSRTVRNTIHPTPETKRLPDQICVSANRQRDRPGCLAGRQHHRPL